MMSATQVGTSLYYKSAGFQKCRDLNGGVLESIRDRGSCLEAMRAQFPNDNINYDALTQTASLLPAGTQCSGCFFIGLNPYFCDEDPTLGYDGDGSEEFFCVCLLYTSPSPRDS